MANPGRSHDVEVLIAGAGPTGLTLAIELLRRKVPVRLIDKAAHGAEHSQALVVQARTLEQLERYRAPGGETLADQAIARGRKLQQISFWSDRKKIFSLPFDKIPGRYPFVLFLPQNETEALLRGEVERLGGRIERGVDLVAFENGPGGVEAKLGHNDGGEEQVRARWLVGCDGAHSAVRAGLKVPFPGETVGISFFLGDLEVEGEDEPGNELVIHLHRGGDVVFLGRLNDRICRVIVALHEEQGDKGVDKLDRELTLDDFQRAIHKAGLRLKVKSAEWMTPFHINQRKASSYRVASAFLAGDASHIHSPVAGQGMNTGIQDAANLGWKLAAVHEGADARLLESYDEERGAVGEALLRNTSRGLAAATQANPLIEAMRDAVMGLGVKLPPVQTAMLGFISETAIHYRDSSIVKDLGGAGHVRAGDRMPNPDLGAGRLLDGLEDGRHLVLAVDVADAEPLRRQFLRAHLRAISAAELTVELREALGTTGQVLVVRPDGYVGFRGSLECRAEMDAYARLVGIV
jgi:2-polyprenyl-6-methoxyphenol hydroxylase-like FAD-dependent oxidoreductase